jgi:hypothetical protein
MEDQEIKERSQFNGQARPTPPTFYDYPDESGEVLFRVERRGKGFVEAGERVQLAPCGMALGEWQGSTGMDVCLKV